jgi:hypothetical protein
MDKDQLIDKQIKNLQKKIDKQYRHLKNNVDDPNLENQRINTMFGGRKERRKIQVNMGVSFTKLYKTTLREKTLSDLQEKNKVFVNS